MPGILASRSTGPTISMIVSKDIAWMESNTHFLRGWCELRPGRQLASQTLVPPGPNATALYLPVRTELLR
jgi:hypothetical protein